MSLIESIPNVSEGRRPEIVESFASLVRAVPGVRLLDHSADPDHNRSVYTMAGDAVAIQSAVLALAARAVEVIDLRVHRGVHPRMGAIDVIPFVPLGDTSMAECVALAEDVGRAIAGTLLVPVFLYEESARVPERRRLENIRRGEFEGLSARMARREWAPDFGPSTPHPTAGATAVGARRALIAFNVNLDSDRLDVARQVAMSVRESGGGLPFVKALGLTLPDRGGLVQVSMNLTNYERTPIQLVFDRVVTEAERRGVKVLESELIGLIPAAAIATTTPGRLRLRNFSERQILESRLAGL